MTDLAANGTHPASPAAEYHPGSPPQASSAPNLHPLGEPESSAMPRQRIASQIRAFQALADESDLDWDQHSWDELVELMSMDEIFHNSSTDDHGDIIMSVDILLEDIANLYQLPPDQQVWTKSQIRELMGVLKERGRAVFFAKFVSEYQLPIPKLLLAFGVNLCPELRLMSQRTLMYFLNLAMGRALATRDRLSDYSTVDDAIALIREAKNILILTGAGISVSCGIPDFRSRDGLYASLSEYQLDDPQQMFDITYFREKPSVFYSFASKIYPSNFKPSDCHRFIKALEDKGKLLRNYTQNIDTLETRAGVKKVIQCHGSFATASCVECHRQVPGGELEEAIMDHKVPLCTVCHPPSNASPRKKKRRKTSKKKAKGQWDSDVSDESDGPEFPIGIMKPDITFFGEKLSDVFDTSLAQDREKVDLLLVIGTSLKVSPVADLISHIPHSVPQILINKTPIRHINPDIVLLGNADDIIRRLCRPDSLAWELSPSKGSIKPADATQVGDSHVWLFEGAEGGNWLKELELEIDSRGKPPPPKFTPAAEHGVVSHSVETVKIKA